MMDRQQGATGVRHVSSQEEKPWGQTIDRLDRVARAMNPLLLFVAVALIVLNLACVVNLINWDDPPDAVALSPAAAAATAALPAPGATRPH
jgi:hypothetical protein